MKQVKITVNGETITPIIVFDGRWYVGSCEEISGVVTQGYSLESVIRNIHEAAGLMLETTKCSKCIHWDDYGCIMKQMHNVCEYEDLQDEV